MSESKTIVQYDNQNNKCVISRINMSNNDFVQIMRNILLDYDDIKEYEYTQTSNLNNKPDGYYLVHINSPNELEMVQVERKTNVGYIYNTVTTNIKRIYKWELLENKYHQMKPLTFAVTKNQFDMNKLDGKISTVIGRPQSGKTTLVANIIKNLYNNYDYIIFFQSANLPEPTNEFYDQNPECSKVKYLPMSALKDTFKTQQDNNKKYLVVLNLSPDDKDDGFLEVINNNTQYNMTVIITSTAFNAEIMGKSNYVFNLRYTPLENLNKIYNIFKFTMPFRKLLHIYEQLETYEAQVIDTNEKEFNNCVMYKANI